MMPQTLKLSLHQGGSLLEELALEQPLEVGRQRHGEPKPLGVQTRRLIIAHENDGAYFHRRHLTLTPLVSGLVRVDNHSRVPLEHDGPARTIAVDGSADLSPPFRLSLRGLELHVGVDAPLDVDGMHSLNQSTVAPGSHPSAAHALQTFPMLSGMQRQGLAVWLQEFTTLLQSSLSSANLYERAAQAIVQLGLSTGCVLLRQDDDWKVQNLQGRAVGRPDWKPSRQVLDRLRQEKRTFFRLPTSAVSGDSGSVLDLAAVVAAPVLDRDNNLLGALYGERGRDGGLAGPTTGNLEAALVELLACSVASGLERDRMVRVQVQFEQFFGEHLARELQKEPGLLQGKSAEVTLLFCDVRRFSTFCKKLTPAQVSEWMNDVLGELSACVLANDGVLVDYIGDEILAMWGAPRSQPDQAVRGVRAGLAMVHDALPRLNQRWAETLGRPMELGVGLNTGLAQVGNVGSRFKFKYGPLGDAVNLASRVQGITKYLGCPLLVTRTTREKLSDEFISRRVCKARLVNMPEAVDLYQVEMLGTLDRREFFRDSELALDSLETRSYMEAAREAAPLLRVNTRDKPLLLILSRATHHMLYPEAAFDPVWEPPGK
jgi:adenylate cyclase